MKKLAVLCAMLCILAVPAYAQLNTGGYVKSYWIPYRLTVPETGDMTHTTAVQTPWGEPDISAGMNFDGWSEWGGFHLGIDIANGAGNQSAHAKTARGSGWVWVKPFGFIPYAGMDSFTIWLGNPVHEQLMGKIGGSNLATYVLNRSYYINSNANNRQRAFRLEIQNPEYNTFTRINPYSWGNGNFPDQNLWWPRISAAAMITWEPIKNLFIAAFVAPEAFDLDPSQGSSGWLDFGGVKQAALRPVNGGYLKEGDINEDYYDVKEVYKKIQAGAGYDIPGFGYARLQYVGMRNTLEAALQLKGLGDLMLDIGFKLPFEGTEKDKDNLFLTATYKKKRDLVASVAATFRDYDFRLLGRVDAAFAGSDSSGRSVMVRGLNLIAYIVPSYMLSVGTVGIDLGFEYEQKDEINGWEKDSMQAGAGIWFARSMGNAQFKAAIAARMPLEWEGIKQPFDFFIPIMLEVGF